MADKRTPNNLTLSSYFPELPSKQGDHFARGKRVDDSRGSRPRYHNSGRRKSGGDVVNDKGTQTNGTTMELRGPRSVVPDPSFPKKKTHPVSHKVMLLSAVLSLAKKQKISGDVESTLLYYLHKEPFIKEAEDLCPLDEDNQAIAFRDIASKLPFPPYPLKVRGDQKSWLQKSIEEELGPETPYLITGPEKWNRLDFGATVLFGLHLVYTNSTEKEVSEKGLRFRKVPFELPTAPPKEWFVVDLCNNIKSSDVTAQDFTARMRRLVADGKLDSQLLLQYADQFGDENTKAIVKDGTQVFLHQAPQFSSWLKQAAAHHKLGEFTVLREYLVAHVLYSLQVSNKWVFLKGGCSLSLGYNLINRTSEDIDLRIEPSMGVIWEVNGSENAEHTRAEYFLKLLDSIFIEDGEVELMHTKCKTTQALYHITFELPHHAPITIVLEVMHKVAPLYIPCKIVSKFHQYARTTGKLENFKQNYDFEIACVHPWQTLYEKIHAVHQNFNKFQSRCTDGNINAPKWIRHLGDAYNIIRKTKNWELPEDWTIARLQEELSKSRDFVTDLSPDHPTLRHELLTDSERKQVEEAFAVHVEGAYYGVDEGAEGGEVAETGTTPTLQEVCEAVVGWLRSVPTTFVSVDKFRRFPRTSYRGNTRHHSHQSLPLPSPSDSASTTDLNSATSYQGRNSSFQRSSSSSFNSHSKTYPPKSKYNGNSSSSTPSSNFNKNSTNAQRNYNANFPAPNTSNTHSDTQNAPSASPPNSTSLDTTDETAIKMSRQVDSSYRLSGSFNTPASSNSNTDADSNDSNDESIGNDSTYSNDSANDSGSAPESPSESSAESSNENDFSWGTIIKAPRAPSGRRELLESSSERESDDQSEPAPSAFPAFNEASFGPKRSSLRQELTLNDLALSPITPSTNDESQSSSSSAVPQAMA